MSAQATLFQLYEEWRAWTHAEREAIEAGDWNQLAKCQLAKTELQARIVRQTQAAQNEAQGSLPARADVDRRVRSVINELIYLETRNGEFLEARKRQTRAEMDELDRSNRTLSKIHKQYTQNAPAAWESYS